MAAVFTLIAVVVRTPMMPLVVFSSVGVLLSPLRILIVLLSLLFVVCCLYNLFLRFYPFNLSVRFGGCCCVIVVVVLGAHRCSLNSVTQQLRLRVDQFLRRDPPEGLCRGTGGSGAWSLTHVVLCMYIPARTTACSNDINDFCRQLFMSYVRMVHFVLYITLCGEWLLV